VLQDLRHLISNFYLQISKNFLIYKLNKIEFNFLKYPWGKFNE
jgi:hypothetical protein